MITSWQTNAEYKSFLHDYRMSLPNDKYRFFFNRRFGTLIKAMARLDIDAGINYLAPLYPKLGRPAQSQSQILRAFILMGRVGENSVDTMVARLRSDPDLAALAGLTPSNVPGVASFYEFQYRFWTQDRDDMHLGVNDVLPCDRNANARDEVYATAKEKGIGNDGKLPDSNPSITEECERIIRGNGEFPNSFGPHYQMLLRVLGIDSSIQAGLLKNVQTVSGDGTCFHVHANPNGHHRCNCIEQGITNCTCDRHFSDPDATWGYDSDLKEYYYGHTIYTLTAHSAEYHVDLPMSIRILSARRHDSASGLITMHEFFRSNSDLSFLNVCLDSAHDNMPTYRLCKDIWKVNPLIDLNLHRGRKKSIPDTIVVGDDGVPICQAGQRMTYDGMDRTRNRLKYRCPLAAAHQDTSTCPCIGSCSSSKTGRCFYVKAADDIRLYPPISRDSAQYKEIYKDRTSCERVNNRILNDYKLANYRGRTAMRLFFFSVCHAINIHLDAQIKVLPDSCFADVLPDIA